MEKAGLVDNKMKSLGFRRISSQELVVDNMVEKIIIYEGIGYEDYTEL